MRLRTPEKIRIGSRLIGGDEPCFIIAEAGINHNGDLPTAKKMIDLAKRCQVDAVKFQTFKAEEFISDPTLLYEYETQNKRVRESMFEMFKRHEFSPQEWREIKRYCDEREIIFMSTPASKEDLDFLLELGIPAVKVGSDDLTNLPLLEAYSRADLPLLISTGMSYLSEIEEAVKVIYRNNKNLIIMHCVSSYPTELREINLRKMSSLQGHFPDAVIGFSDHSFGTEAALGAVALGCKVYEKHFTLDHERYGPDHRFSADPDQLEQLVQEIRKIEQALGSAKLVPTHREMAMRALCRRSVVAARDIQRGEVIREGMLALKRPGTGIQPKDLRKLIGKKIKRNVKKDGLIKPSYV